MNFCFMSKKRMKSRSESNSKVKDEATNSSLNTTPKNAKIVLFVFGIGPLILMGAFLFFQGFFNSP